jgi:2-keto-4-pentenoate hydratase/2-oxohepta-3-ene-1,7-dioic acid hydratase in catechol pathway
MKICRFDDDKLGIVQDREVIDVSAALDALPSVRWPYPPGDALIANWVSLEPHIANAVATGPRHPLASVKLRSPVANPTKVIGIARNRRDLDKENLDTGIVVTDAARKNDNSIQMFIKAPSALAGPSDGVEIRFPDRRNDPEAEFTVIVGRKGTDIPRDRALDYVFGYCIGLDMTLRGSESASSRKSIDSYAVVGPWIVTRDELTDPDSVSTALYVNGDVLQQANTNDLAFDIRSLIAHASTFYTLYPGDVIMAGTPASFAPIKAGDVMVADFAGIGRMEVAVRRH